MPARWVSSETSTVFHVGKPSQACQVQADRATNDWPTCVNTRRTRRDSSGIEWHYGRGTASKTTVMSAVYRPFWVSAGLAAAMVMSAWVPGVDAASVTTS